MWTVVYIISSQRYAEQIKETLAEEGFLAMLRSTDTSNNYANSPVEILVLESEAEDASRIINEILSN